MAARAVDPAIREHLPFEYRIIRPMDGKVRWMLAYGEVVYATVNGVEQPVRYVGTLQDITATVKLSNPCETVRPGSASLSMRAAWQCGSTILPATPFRAHQNSTASTGFRLMHSRPSRRSDPATIPTTGSG